MKTERKVDVIQGQFPADRYLWCPINHALRVQRKRKESEAMMSSYHTRFLSVAEERVEIAAAPAFEPAPSFGKALFWNALLLAGILNGAYFLIRLIGKL